MIVVGCLMVGLCFAFFYCVFLCVYSVLRVGCCLLFVISCVLFAARCM